MNLTMQGFEGMWINLEFWARKEIDCCKQNLQGHSKRILEESSAQESIVPEENRDLSINWTSLRESDQSLPIAKKFAKG